MTTNSCRSQFLLNTLLSFLALLSAQAGAAEPLGPSSRNTSLIFSEILFHPTNRNDGVNLGFVELYNAGPFAEDLSGFRISGDISFTFPSNTWLAAQSFLVVAADSINLSVIHGITNVAGPYAGLLGLEVGTVRMRNRAGALLLETSYASDLPGFKLADGRGHSIVLARPSLGEADPRAWAASAAPGGSPGGHEPLPAPLRAVVINEILANSEPPDLDFIEIYNRSDQDLDISGCSLSDNPNVSKFVFRATSLGAHSYLALDEVSFGFDLRNTGDTVYFRDPAGVILDAITYGALPDGVSFGRVPTGGPDFASLSPPTPFAPNTRFHSGDIIINEILYAPLSGNSDDEFIELHNRSTEPVDVSGWRFTAGIDFTNPPGTLMAPGSYLVVGRNAARLKSHYPQLNSGNVVGDYEGSLADDGERLALARPELVVDGSTTNTVYVLVQELAYGTGGGKWSHGGGSSLELIDARSENQLAANWADSDETGKAPWTTIETSGVVDLGISAADEIHALMLGEGECLLDSIEVQPGFGVNLLDNGTFESNPSGWVIQGNHVRSSIEPGGYGGGLCLHLRSSGPGDTGVNRVECDLNSTPATGSMLTIRAKARWLRGHSGLLLRLNGNGLEATRTLQVPLNPGTPGLPNSRAATNAGPAILDVTHTPTLPEAFQQLIVTAHVHDPDGISQLRLRYRVDPNTNMATVQMRDDGTGGDVAAADGVFSAAIPGLPQGGLVAFYIEAIDQAQVPVTSRFPAEAPARECLVCFGEAAPSGTLGDYRLWMTSNNLAAWRTRPKLSDEPLDCTLVWGGARVIYNAGIRYDGDALRRAGFQSPTNGPSICAVTLPAADTLLGSRLLTLEGVNLAGDPTGLRELTAFWMASRAGLPVIPPRLVHVQLNGTTNSRLHLDRHLPDAEFLTSWFEEAADGELFEAAAWIEATDGSDPAILVARDPTLQDFTTSGGVKKQARYRWNWRKRFNARLDDNYAALFGLVNAFLASDSTYVNHVDPVLDPEWITALAFRHVIGDWNGYGQQGANDAVYVDGAKKWRLLPDRFLYALGAANGQGTTQDPFLSSEPTMIRLLSQPQFRRQYLQRLQEAIADPMQPASYAPFLNFASQALLTNGIGAGSTTDIASWIDARRNFLTTQLPVVVPFVPSVSLAGNLVTLTGIAPLGVRSILVEKLAPGAISQFNGKAYPLKWTSVTTWTLEVPLEGPTQSLSVTAHDAQGQVLFAWNVPVGFFSVPSPYGVVVINEIMTHPSTPGGAFVELHNTSPYAFDVSGWRLVELDMTFTNGTLLRSGGFLVCAQDRNAFVAAYGADVPVAAEFQGQLRTDAGTLTLRKPDGAIVDKVQYDNHAPWPNGISQDGISLQLIDSRQDNSRVANWAVVQSNPPAWNFQSFTAIMPINSTTFALLLANTGDLYIDDMWLVPGTEPAVGSNYLANGDFEIPTIEPWTPIGSYTNSEISTNFSHSGGSSLRLAGATPGSSGSYLRQFIPGNTSTQVFTLSFWCRSGSESNQLTARTTPGTTFLLRMPVTPQNLAPFQATPGATNFSGSLLPTLPPLWINEVEAVNDTGATDNFGEHEPWIELHNAGASTVNLGGYALSDNYTNYSQWLFPQGASIGPGAYLVIWADGETNESSSTNLHTNFRLNPSGGFLAFSSPANPGTLVLDYLNYPATTPDRSYGSSPNGQGLDRTRLNPPTPGASNIPPVNLFINEWMASNFSTPDPADGNFDDWFEIYNASLDPFDLRDCYLTDALNNPTQFRVPPGYVIPPRGFLLVWADGDLNQNTPLRPDLHVNFKLSRTGDSIGLFAPDGFTHIDSMTFTNQTNNISQGRFADGTGAIYFMSYPTPGGPNLLTPPNRPPAIQPIPEITIRLGQTVSLTAVAIDPDIPAQTLVFNRVGPVGSSISASGMFTWTPSIQQAPSTNTIELRVTDNGSPPLAGLRNFSVIVRMPPLATINAFNDGHLAIRFDAITGRTYRVDWKEHLEDATWTPLGPPAVATGTSVVVTDEVLSGSQRFYRVVQLD